MAKRVEPGGGAAQDQKEKKDAAHHPEGRSLKNEYEDPQAEQSKGKRKNPSHQQDVPKTQE